MGLDTPGPASAEGVISSVGSTNFSHSAWPGFDVRGALEVALGAPVVYPMALKIFERTAGRRS